jgi:hypothetical protein
MSKSYVIQWTSKVNGRVGKGTKRFGLEEAQELVRELNVEYPDIHHEMVEAELEPPPHPPAAEEPEPSHQEPEQPPAPKSSPAYSVE